MAKGWLSSRATWLEENWTETVELGLPAVLLIVMAFMSDEFARKLAPAQLSGLIQWCALLGGLLTYGGILVFHFKVVVPKRLRLADMEEQLDELREERGKTLQQSSMAATGLLVSIASDKLEFGSKQHNTERITLYMHHSDSSTFVPMGRYSPNPLWKTKGQSLYPISSGCLNQAWAHSTFFCNDLPDPDQNWQEYIDAQARMGVDADRVVRLTMKSQLYFGFRIDHHTPADPLGVIVVESTDPKRFAEGNLVDIFENQVKHEILMLATSLQPNIPTIAEARKAGL